MRKSFVIILLCLPFVLTAQVDFDKYFTGKVLRFDFMFAGNSSKITVYPSGMKEEPFYAGSRTQLIDPFNYGNFKYEVFDAAENKLLYSRGFSTLFQEWQTTAEARVMERSFYEVATMPFPKNKIRFVISARERKGTFYKLYETEIDPTDQFIRKEKPVTAKVNHI
ncbi:MAG TPA: peptidase M64 N-terminal domain-containing protein, partial [Bacteroidales bacterium]|nr:peptidase M64 N-terminal domain-containing protein [Bacteroidales bacterium]